ncbi:MAG: type II toxin-antitoxin system VapC family toxin [Legionella sp.]|nr:type II toxin-antitoxin system VapC family toxin [Legionella sp.]
MTSVVLDTSALLAYVKGEPGADEVAAVIGDAVISTVNYAEAVTKLVDKGLSLVLVREALGIAGLDVIDFDRNLAEAAGAMFASTKPFGLSLGDRACLALAGREGVQAMTGDRIWSKLGAEFNIRLIR